MSTAPTTDPDGAGRFEFRLQGRLDPRWSAHFEGMTLTTGHGQTLLAGPVVDQAALHGLLHRLRDVGLPLVSVVQVQAVDESPPPTTRSTPDPTPNPGA